MGGLNNAIREVYDVFSRYHLPEDIEMSPYRDPEREIGPLKLKPLRQVEAADLESYANHALTTVGDVDLFRYALPRLLELCTQGALTTEVEILLSKLRYGEWATWPEQEQESIQRLLGAWWNELLYESVDFDNGKAHETLCGIAQAVDDLTPYLEIWEGHEGPTATDQIARVFNTMYNGNKGRFVAGAFWAGRATQAEQVWQWMTRSVVLDRLQHGLLIAIERDQEELLEAYEWAVTGLGYLLVDTRP
ncbi:hypothetical protein [Deinococcus peraridilitoris]|uniref:Uncharacterized protein n=1 Tax=Deinococcus peraridilitoris (strain DSM 19664 / LMG 22246 / CIP 109416 / KR-200) TaxID=937777 RepID=L0A9N0_DEIPD|nr:hypothetical protein Deipe_4436 [Deinococcus peraridilitoris DSM 19664]